MQDLLKLISARETLLKKAIRKAMNEENSFPQGRLRISRNEKYVRYYHMQISGDTSGKYLTKKEINKISSLAQKDYNKRFQNIAAKEMALWESVIIGLKEGDADSVFRELSPERKCFVAPYIQTDELYAKEWKEKKYSKCSYKDEEKKYDTKRGEKVRSKSEAILADMFYEMEIPYRYEEAVKLKNGQILYPDFTLLKVKTRDVYYLEHFGLMEDEEYRRHNLQKLDEYRNNGIYPGKNLLFTYETNDSPLDIKGIRRMLKEIILEG